MDLRNYELIILDCDGVIFDSNLLKLEAFKDSLEIFDRELVLKFIEFIKHNFGSSRYKLFEIFLKDFLKMPFDRVVYNGLLEKYSASCVSLYENAEFTEYLIEFLEFYKTKALYIVSGSDQNELVEAFERRDLKKYFINILGSPRLKADLVSDIVSNNQSKTVLIGDAEADKLAAEGSCIVFIFMKDYSTNAEMLNDNSLVSIGNLGELM